MSYSFNVRAQSKGQVREAVNAKLADVVQQQPIHDHDRSVAETAVADILDLIGAAPDGMEFSVHVHGSCWQRDGVFGGISVGVDISHHAPVAAG